MSFSKILCQEIIILNNHIINTFRLTRERKSYEYDGDCKNEINTLCHICEVINRTFEYKTRKARRIKMHKTVVVPC